MMANKNHSKHCVKTRPSVMDDYELAVVYVQWLRAHNIPHFWTEKEFKAAESFVNNWKEFQSDWYKIKVKHRFSLVYHERINAMMWKKVEQYWPEKMTPAMLAAKIASRT